MKKLNMKNKSLQRLKKNLRSSFKDTVIHSFTAVKVIGSFPRSKFQMFRHAHVPLQGLQGNVERLLDAASFGQQIQQN